MSPVRVRFAPSPTGFFHIGSARTALFNWLYARHTGGTFVLRIEDTDKERNSDEFLQVIYDSLRWLGLNWDEGPLVGGGFGPYRQSERADIYRAYLDKLSDAGRTYEREGATFFRISGKPQIIDDAIRGRVERTEEKDFVIIRSDGNPVFHFVNVVDDIAMKITHVIRGEDHLSNTSKHTELFQAFGAPMPVYAHIPLILKQHGPGKMSKRDQGALIEEYQRRGFQPEALVNFLCLLGWSPKNDQEKMPIEEIIRLFDLPAVHQGNARFDEKKMAHMNMAYLHAMTPDQYYAVAAKYLGGTGFLALHRPEEEYLRSVLALCQVKVRSLEELPAAIGYFFTEDFPYDAKSAEKIRSKGDPCARLQEFLDALTSADFSSDASLETWLQGLAASKGMSTSDYIHPGRFAFSGGGAGPTFYGVLRVIGPERAGRRIRRFLGIMGPSLSAQ